MPFCVNCGTKIETDDIFCPECGYEVTIRATKNVVDENKDDKPIFEEDKKEERKVVYEGEIRKCPNCGEILKSFSANCPACGYELRGVKTKSSVEELSYRIQQAKTIDEKNDLIINFYIPNTKEDIYDFFILAISNLENSMHDTDAAWKSKLEQAYQKAQLLLGDSPEFPYFQELYEKSQKTVKNNRKSDMLFSVLKSSFLWAGLMAIVGIVLLISKGFDSTTSYVGMMLLLASISVACFAAESKKKKVQNYSLNSDTVLIKSKPSEYIMKHYDDVMVLLKKEGFVNIECTPVKKGILDTEGNVKEVSIDGITDFKYGDQFDKEATVLVRYYSRNC